LFSRHLLPPLWQGAPSRAALAQLGAALVRRSVESCVVAFAVGIVLATVRGARARTAVVSVLVVFHLWVANHLLYEFGPPSVIEHPGSFVERLRTGEPPARLGGARVLRVKGGYGTDYDRDP